MFVKHFTVLFMFTFFVFCEQSFVDTLKKCLLEDEECLAKLYQNALHDIGETGIPEANIPPVDPFVLKDVTVNILEGFDVTIVEGVAKGIKDCVFKKFSLNMKEERAFQENVCDLSIEGHYKLDSTSPVFEGLFGQKNIHGEGNGKIEVRKLHLKFDVPFYVQKRSDGEMYLKINFDTTKYEYSIDGKVSFAADNLYLGDKEMSKTIVDTLNENSELIATSFGKPLVDKAVKDFYFKTAANFFNAIPAKYFIIDDLTPYAKP